MPANLFAGMCPACGGSWLDARYNITALPHDWPAQLQARSYDLWRYRELLPFPDDFEFVSMGDEGWTPLIRARGLERELEYGALGELWIKDERRQPTGSFKDRQAAFTTSVLKAQGIDELVLASTGNAAAAYAAYCARAGIKLWVFLPSSVPAEKMRELALYGAEVVKITGTYDQAKQVAGDFAARRGIYQDTGARSIPGKESMKTIALEIVEQLGWRAPDWYVQAVSGGIGPLGVLKGFEELYAAGIIDRVPKLGIIQAEGCAPMVRAWEKGLDKAEPVIPDTLITVLSTGKPGLAYEILKKANDRYGGAMVAVADGDAFRAMRRVARIEGYSMEPAASVAFAGLEKLIENNIIRADECVVVNCSGHTFSAEKHALEDRYAFHLQMAASDALAIEPTTHYSKEGLVSVLEQLDEQITTIVIVDDNPHDSRLIRRLLLRYKNYRVFEAHSGTDGLDLVRQRQPDLVVLDLTLPDMDGFSILEKLKTDPRTSTIPVVIVSAKSLSDEEWTRLRRYTQSIWQKGAFGTQELVHHVVELLGDKIEPPKKKVEKTTRGESSPMPEEEVTFGADARPRILVIDDNLSDARLLHRLFQARQRFRIDEAHSAHEALQVIAQDRPDLIILDLILPDIAGEQLLETLRNMPEMREVPIIVMSAKDIPPAQRMRLTALADSLWEKGTLDRSNFLAHIEAILPE
ncbi:MAG TPA: pyridoxal-phosphate dependent enzyme [Anaerolineae bacterium]|nr:pyridoxal-phosphate dependent enzyme [Anaerolineae bacterium]HQK13895.1 pyridoxal-phosphate dependent enzyme [Anaerolineae bacterium]